MLNDDGVNKSTLNLPLKVVTLHVDFSTFFKEDTLRLLDKSYNSFEFIIK